MVKKILHLNKNAQQRDRSLWDLVADDFISFIHKKDNGNSDILRNELLLPNLFDVLGEVSGKRILDVGCGDGALSQELELRGAIVEGFDFSEKMIDAARERKKKNKLKATFMVGSVHDPDLYEHESFDILIANMVLHELDDLEKVVESLLQHLKPGGTFIFSIFHPAFDMNISQAVNYTDLDRALEENSARWQYEITTPYKTEVRYERSYAFSDKLIPYYFRPIETYVRTLIDNEIRVRIFKELALSYNQAKKAHNKGHAYFVPRFLLVGGDKL